MIQLINNIPSGNACSIYLNPPTGSISHRLLRNTTGIFSSQNDILCVYEGSDIFIIDTASLDNDTLYYYSIWYWDGSLWTTYPIKSMTPSFTVFNRSVDVLTLVRDRIDKGMNNLIKRGDITHTNGYVTVLIASPQLEDVTLPIITVHLTNDSDDNRFINDQWRADIKNPEFSVTSFTGYLSSVTLDIVVWCLNGDQRNQYRNALKDILIANIPVFIAGEMMETHFQFADAEDFQSYASPMYFMNATLRCLAPSAYIDTAPAIIDIVSHYKETPHD